MSLIVQHGYADNVISHAGPFVTLEIGKKKVMEIQKIYCSFLPLNCHFMQLNDVTLLQ